MKPIKTLLLLACLLWLAAGAFGAQVDATTAASVITGWLRLDQTPFGEKLGGKVNSVETFKDDNGVPMYYVVYLEPSGFVIVSADNQVEPIIAFVRQGRFDPSLKNPLGALVSRDVPVRVARVRARGGSQPALKIAGNKWQKLLQSAAGVAQPMGIPTGSISDLRVAPFIQTLWNQSTADNTTNGPACYNFFTPPFAAGASSNYVCGCVATALAQLMYYFQYPSIGVGTPSFIITLTTPAGGTQQITRKLRGGDGNGGPYVWTNMPLDPSGGATLSQCAAIGALTYDAGVAVHMSYAPSESGAYMSDAKTALVSTFQYNNAVLVEGTNLDVGVGLFGMINPNLDARLPVVFGIDNSFGGHCIVCDGYGYDAFSTLYHHLNMGWGGDDNAWYALPIIDLADTDPFINIDACIYNVFTNGNGEIISGRVLDTNGVPIPGANVTATRVGSGSTYTAVADANGIYALVGVPSASTYTLTVTNTGYFPASSNNYSTATSLDDGTNSGNIWGADFTLVPAIGPPVITVQPENQFVTVGANATFNITATGQLPLFYQWQSQPNGSLNWVNVNDDGTNSGSQTPTLTISPTDLTMNGEPFQCIVTNTLGSVTSSPSATLFVNVAPYLNIATIAGLAGNPGAVDGTNGTARFNNPRGIAVDNNTNVYVTDLYNHTIRKLALSGTNWVVSTIAGLAGTFGSADGINSNARFNGPYGITVDNNTNVYVADTGNNTIRKLTPSGTNWVVSTIAGLAGSPGSTDGSHSLFHYPMGIAIDSGGNLYVTDEGNSTIRELTPSGTNWVTSTLAGLVGIAGSTDGTNSGARFNGSYGIAVDSGGNLYVADMYSYTIRKLKPVGINWVVTTIAGLPYNSGSSDGIGSAARFYYPAGIAVDHGGNLYVADEGNYTIRRLTLAGTNWTVFTAAGLAGSPGSADGIGSAARFNGPYAIAVDGNTNIYVADSINCTIRKDPLIVVPVPSFVQLVKQQTDGTFTLAWNAMVWHAYQVQFKTNLSQTAWITLTNVTATSWTGIASIPVGPDPQRFYRVIPLQ
ncbi:MAG: C10 family peptidase [Verrucomicrobiota bacterium]|jgi:sugar lactone lactonase YvrE